jgi:hypothetical protein
VRHWGDKDVKHLLFKLRFIGLIAFALVGGMWPVGAQAAGGLGAAAGFSVLAGTALTCTDATVTGLAGVASASTAVTKTRCHINVQVATTAYNDFLTVYDGVASNLGPCDQTFGIADTLAGVTLGSGIYCFEAAATLTGTLTLTGAGPWFFEIGTLGTGALTFTNFTVVGGDPCSTFWWVRQDATATTSTIEGTILANSITLTGTALTGRAFAKTAVTMTGGTVFGCTAGGTVTTSTKHCNQGVGNGPEGCDPGNSNQGDPSRSNDELGGTPGNPGRKGGNSNATVETKSVTIAKSSATVTVAPKVTTQPSSNHGTGAKGKSDLHANGNSNARNK